jgi:hypothetical protein
MVTAILEAFFYIYLVKVKDYRELQQHRFYFSFFELFLVFGQTLPDLTGVPS